MTKIVFLFMIMTSVFANAQDSLVVLNSKTKKNLIQVDFDSISKVQFEPNFKSKYNSKEFVYEVKSPKKNSWDRFLDWLSNMLQKLFNFSNNEVAMNTTVIILKIIAVLIIGFAVFKIVKALLNKEGQWVFGKNTHKKIENDYVLEKNLTTINFEILIQKTLATGDARLTLRYYYLWLLQKLSEKKIIQWDPEKTNSDYLNEIKNTNQKDQFAYLSYLYNYSWYGEFELEKDAFEKAKIAFEAMIKSLES